MLHLFFTKNFGLQHKCPGPPAQDGTQFVCSLQPGCLSSVQSSRSCHFHILLGELLANQGAPPLVFECFIFIFLVINIEVLYDLIFLSCTEAARRKGLQYQDVNRTSVYSSGSFSGLMDEGLCHNNSYWK